MAGQIIYTVKEGAVLECTLGTKKSILKVPKYRGFTLQGENQATILDYVPYVNIFPFEKCKRTMILPECTPKIVIPWINGKIDYIIHGELALLNICFVPCIYGGIVTIVSPGQNSSDL